MARLELPDNHELAGKVLDAEAQKTEIGLIGKLFGSRKHAPTNIAGVVLLISLLVLAALPFAEAADPGIRPEVIKIFAGIAIAALGYVFGSWRSNGD